MVKEVLTVARYMTAMPHTIRPGCTLAEAHRVMREHGIRHLPVLDGGQLVGVVSQRDLHLIESLDGVEPSEVPVEDAMSQEVYRVSPEEPLAQVCATMAEHRYGSAVVMQQGRVVGIFTAVDALRALSEQLPRPA